MARVNVNVTARDLTGNDLRRIRASFSRLGQDMDRAVGQRNRANFERLRTSMHDTNRQLQAMRGSIPDNQFFRMDEAMRRAQRTMARGFNRVGDRAFQRVQQDLDGILTRFNRLNERGRINIRTRVDPAALARADARLRAGLRDRTVNVRVNNANLRNSADAAGRTMRQRLMNALRPFPNFITGILSDGVGQGLSDGFRNAGPPAIAAFAAALLSAAAYIGTALAGVITLAFGGAFVALGAMLAAKSAPVKAAWKNAAADVKAAWKGAGDALIPVIEHGITLMQKLSDSFLPHFKEAMRHAQSPLNDFLDNMAKSLKDFGKRAFDPMMEGFDTLLLAFGPQWDEFMQGLGDAMGNLGRTVTRHSGEIAMALKEILGLITTLIDIINFLTETWSQMARFFTFNIGSMEKVLAGFIRALTYVGSSIVGAFEPLGYLIPGFSGKIKKAKEAVSDFGNDIADKLDKMGQDAIDWGSKMDRANKKRKLKVDIAGWKADLEAARKDLKDTLSAKAVKKLQADIREWTAKLNEAKKKLQNTTATKAKAKLQADIRDLQSKINRAKKLLSDQSHRKSKSQIKGDIADLQRKIASARKALNALNGKTATTYVVTNYTQIRNKGYSGNSATGGHAHGGIVGAASGGIRSQLTMVGEQGPELVRLPSGSQVRSNSDSRRLIDRDGGGGGIGTLQIVAGQSDVEQFLLKILRRAIRVQGGNVQTVLGRG